jgi:hypothetical protein
VLGAPSLKPDAFASFNRKTVVGITLRVTAPLGQYDADKLINLGSNRWIFSPQVGSSQIAGHFIFEDYGGAWFFTDNNEFFSGETYSQDPLFTIQAHLGYRIRRRFWIAISTRQSLGGSPITAGGVRLTSEANNRIGLTASYPIGRRQTIKLVITTGVTATIGNDYTTAAATVQFVL